MTAEPRLQRVLDRINQCNSEDPNQELVGGLARPRELVYSQRLTEWVLRLAPHASEWLRIAARGQHIHRWTIPRERYERNRRGYLRWRETLKTFHAAKVGEIMREEGYAEERIRHVQSIMLKKQLATDPETQTLEDALCLVFLETQFRDLRQKVPDSQMKDVLRKTWKKMSEQARQEALRLPLSEDDKRFVAQAVGLSPEGSEG